MRASATQALQVFSPSPHLHTLQTHYSRSVKPAIPGSVASGCGEHRRRAFHRADRRPVQSPAVLRSRQNRECRDQRDVGGETYSKQNGGCAVSTIVEVLLALSYVGAAEQISVCFSYKHSAPLAAVCHNDTSNLRAAFSKALPVAYSLFYFQIAKRYIKPLLLSYSL